VTWLQGLDGSLHVGTEGVSVLHRSPRRAVKVGNSARILNVRVPTWLHIAPQSKERVGISSTVLNSQTRWTFNRIQLRV
jgi:hypothetical protein